MGKKFTICNDNGEAIATLDVAKGVSESDVLAKIAKATRPSPVKAKRSTPVEYTILESVSEADDAKKIVFKFAGNKTMYISLPDRKTFHGNGEEFLKSHYERVRCSMDTVRSTATGWVSMFMDYMMQASGRHCNVSYRADKFGTYLQAFMNSEYIGAAERLAKSGVLVDEGHRVADIDYSKDTIPEMLGVDKWFIKQISGKEFGSALMYCYKKAMEHEHCKMAFRRAYEMYGQVIDTNIVDIIQELITRYNYDWIRLTDYCFTDVLAQGEDSDDGVRKLRDYVQMCTDMRVEYEKFPKYLATLHNMAQAKYKLQQDRYLQNRYDGIITHRQLKKYEYSPLREKYMIKLPKSPGDIVKEGDDLSHCVASYIGRMFEGDTLIMFMRERKNKNKSLLTVEIIRGHIAQVKGYLNRAPKDDELVFLDKYKEFLNTLNGANNSFARIL